MTMNGNDGQELGHGYYFEDLTIGMEANYAKTITDQDVLAFADLSGDVNPVHLSDELQEFSAGELVIQIRLVGHVTDQRGREAGLVDDVVAADANCSRCRP